MWAKEACLILAPLVWKSSPFSVRSALSESKTENSIYALERRSPTDDNRFRSHGQQKAPRKMSGWVTSESEVNHLVVLCGLHTNAAAATSTIKLCMTLGGGASSCVRLMNL